MGEDGCVGCAAARILVPNHKTGHALSGPISGVPGDDGKKGGAWRRQCGCMRTSDKLKNILGSFPNAPPPSPNHAALATNDCCDSTPGGAGGRLDKRTQGVKKSSCFQGADSRSWQVIAELVQLVQLSVTATALALYYLIYCYMQLVYYTLRSALYFHHADGPMKITIGIVTLTSLVVGFNLLLRMEKVLGIIY